MKKFLTLVLMAMLLLPACALAENITAVEEFVEGYAIVTNESGKMGAIDTTGRLVVPCQYDDMEEFSSGTALVERNEKTGFVNGLGEEIVPCEYDGGWSMHDGLGVVWKDNVYGLVNGLGEYQPVEDVSLRPSYGGWVFAQVRGTWAFLVTNIGTGEFFMMPEGYAPLDHKFVDGYAIIYEAGLEVVDGKSGIMDTEGNIVVPCQYDTLYDLENGLCKAQKDGKYGYIRATGETVVPHKYEMVGDFSEGMAYVKNPDGLYGFVDETGREIVPCKYKSVGSFSEGMARVQNEKGEYGFINPQGKLVISFQSYRSVLSFYQGRCAVMTNEGKIGFLDTTGKMVIEPQYSSCGYFTEEGVCRVKKDGAWGIIDREGKAVYPCEYQQAHISEGYFTLLKDGRVTVVPIQ